MSGWIDITRPLINGMIQWPGDQPFEWTQTDRITGPGTSNQSEFRMGMHVGTHIDAPLHFLAGGEDISDLSLDKLCGSAAWSMCQLLGMCWLRIWSTGVYAGATVS